jgi:hypothetical protein
MSRMAAMHLENVIRIRYGINSEMTVRKKQLTTHIQKNVF